MTEPIAPEPIPAETLRTLAVAELATFQNLLVYLDLEGLRFVRNRLHSPDLVCVCDEGPLAETRAVLLDITCRALVAFGWAPEQYFLECCDMFPSAPDTLADDNAVPLYRPAAGEVADEPPYGVARWPQETPDDLTGLDDDPTDFEDEPGDGWV
jgi:hypothetical protein